jgi:hypothetical protein
MLLLPLVEFPPLIVPAGLFEVYSAVSEVVRRESGGVPDHDQICCDVFAYCGLTHRTSILYDRMHGSDGLLSARPRGVHSSYTRDGMNGEVTATGVAPIMAMQLSAARKLELKIRIMIRMLLWQCGPSLKGLPARCEGGIAEAKTANMEGVKARAFLYWGDRPAR